MAKNKIKRIVKKEKEESQMGLKSIIIVVLILISVCIGMYFLTENILSNENKPKDPGSSETVIDYDRIIFGNLFNRSYDEYYALVLDYSKDYDNYKSLVTNYYTGTKSIKVFYIDSQDNFNNKYMDEETNIQAKTLEEIKVKSKGLTLIHIKNSKIVKIVDDDKEIRKLLEPSK